MRYIFIHIPKTAGTFVKELIKDSNKIFFLQKKSNKILEIHYSIQFIKKYFKNLENISYFCVSRNPYDRIYSIWKFLNKYGEFGDISLPRVENNFPDFVTEISTGYYDPYYFFAPQKYFIQNENNLNIKIFKFEEMNISLKNFLFENNIDWSYEKINSTGGPQWESQYDEDMKKIIYNKYKEDFKLFGYSR